MQVTQHQIILLKVDLELAKASLLGRAGYRTGVFLYVVKRLDQHTWPIGNYQLTRDGNRVVAADVVQEEVPILKVFE